MSGSLNRAPVRVTGAGGFIGRRADRPGFLDEIDAPPKSEVAKACSPARVAADVQGPPNVLAASLRQKLRRPGGPFRRPRKACRPGDDPR